MWLLAIAVLLLLAAGGAQAAISSTTDSTDGSDAMDTATIGRGLYLRADAAASYLRMQAAAAAAGYTIGPNPGRRVALRTQADEDQMRAEGYPTVAPGRTSKHVLGVALDQNENGEHPGEWLQANASSYGWSFPVASEPWHGEYDPSSDQFAGVGS